MADRASERTKTRDVDELLAEVDDSTADTGETRQRASRETEKSTLRERAGEIFSPRAFLVALVLTAIGVTIGRSIPFIGVV
ncbi:MAG TPA: hypothetical protein VFJ06_09345, partial [Halococcus sp.]|nr:hypothetical protein [Halococcus sp.]